MNITFRQLRLFLALAQTESVTKAARMMHITQPTASMQLKEKDIELIKETEKTKSVIELVNSWLERMPFHENEEDWAPYEKVYVNSLADAEKNNADFFNAILNIIHPGTMNIS